jgi:hypothetical protein
LFDTTKEDNDNDDDVIFFTRRRIDKRKITKEEEMGAYFEAPETLEALSYSSSQALARSETLLMEVSAKGGEWGGGQ